VREKALDLDKFYSSKNTSQQEKLEIQPKKKREPAEKRVPLIRERAVTTERKKRLAYGLTKRNWFLGWVVRGGLADAMIGGGSTTLVLAGTQEGGWEGA